MTFDLALAEFQYDQITIEPWTGFNSVQAATYGAAVTYAAQVFPWVERVINREGREVKSQAKVVIQERLQIDPRSRITLPSGFAPNQPPILAIRPNLGVGLDHTEVIL